MNPDDFEINDIDKLSIDAVAGAITILPSNFNDSEDKYRYDSSAISFYKFAKRQLDIAYLTKPEILYAQKSIDLFLPAILFPLNYVVQSPDLIKMFCEVVFNFAKDSFAGKESPIVHVTFISKKTKTTKLVEVKYKGPLNGLKDMESVLLKAIEHED